MRPKYSLAILIALLASAFVAAQLFDLRTLLANWMDALRQAGPVALLYLPLIYVAATVCMAPGSVLTIAAGALAAATWPGDTARALAAGYLAVACGSVAGATAAFLLGRTLARAWVEQRIVGSARFRAIDDAIAREGFRVVLLLRLSPVFPFNLLNYTLGLTRVPLRHYVVASALGMAPGTLLYVYIGATAQTLAASAAGQDTANGWRTALLVAGLAATFAVVALVTRAAKRALHLPVEPE